MMRKRSVGAVFMVVGAAMMAPACTPTRYMGIDTRVPVTPEEARRIEAALAAAPAGPDGCPWRRPDRSFTTISCDALPLAQLAGFAAMDSKPSLLELGIRFEEGRGVAQDWDKAELAYRRAAWTNTIQTGTQVAGVSGQHGTFAPILVPGTPGLETAEARLAALRLRKKAR